MASFKTLQRWNAYIYTMARVHAPIPIVGNFAGICFYRMYGNNYARAASSLTARQVKTSRRFAKTRYYAGLMARASQIGSSVYNALPVYWRQGWMYRAFTGEALKMLKEGGEEKVVLNELMKTYVIQ